MFFQKKKHKIEFSKKIYYCTFAFVIYTLLMTTYCIFGGRDSTPLIYLIPAAFGAYATSCGFYYKKAEAENVLKISNSQNNQINSQVPPIGGEARKEEE